MSTDQLIEQLKDSSCHAYVAGIEPSYNYVPSLGAGIAFSVLFGLAMAIHTVQFIWKRMWWCSLFSIGAMGELSF
jgi:hypothetical protein